MLWTHFGASGPVILNASRHWLRDRGSRAADTDVVLERDPRRHVRIARDVAAGAAARIVLAHLFAPLLASRAAGGGGRRLDRGRRNRRVDDDGAPDARRLADAWFARCSRHLSMVRDSRGYNYAEVTAGGIPLIGD